jgi:hypothetical protein
MPELSCSSTASIGAQNTEISRIVDSAGSWNCLEVRDSGTYTHRFLITFSY